MVRDFKLDQEDRLGSYVGILASTFCIGQLFSAIPWGWLSDKVGRRPVILSGLVGSAVFGSLFGISKNYTFALITRFLCG
jgi:MFS family permease